MLRRICGACIKRGAASLVAFALLALAPAAARGQNVGVAEALFEKGLADMKAERFDSACPALAESYKLDAAAGTLFTLAECEKKAGKIASALAHYNDYLRAYSEMKGAKKNKHAARAQHAEEQAKALEVNVPKLSFNLPRNAPTNVKVMLDNQELGRASLGVEFPVDPGEHIVTTTIPEGQPIERKVTLSAGDKKTIKLQVPKPLPVDSKPGVAPRYIPMYYGTPPDLPYKEGAPIPPGYQVRKIGRTGLIVSGASIFGTLWIPPLPVAVIYYDQYWPLLIPAVGPFIGIGTISGSSSDHALLVADGALQTISLTMLFAGIIAKQKYLAPITRPPVMLLPFRPGNGGIGLTLVGAM